MFFSMSMCLHVAITLQSHFSRILHQQGLGREGVRSTVRLHIRHGVTRYTQNGTVQLRAGSFHSPFPAMRPPLTLRGRRQRSAITQ